MCLRCFLGLGLGLSVGLASSQAGNQSEIRVSFERPSGPARLSVSVMVDAAAKKPGKCVGARACVCVHGVAAVALA